MNTQYSQNHNTGLSAGILSVALLMFLPACLPTGGSLFPSGSSSSGLLEATVDSSFWGQLTRVPPHILVQFEEDCGQGAVAKGVDGSTSQPLNLSFNPNCTYTKLRMTIGTLTGSQMTPDALTNPGRELTLTPADMAPYVASGQPLPLQIPISDVTGVFGGSTAGIQPTQPVQPIQPVQPTQPVQPAAPNITAFVVGGESCSNCDIFEGNPQGYAALRSTLGADKTNKIYYSQIQSQNIPASMKQALTSNATSWPALVAFNAQGQMCFSQTSVHNQTGASLASQVRSRCQ